MAVSLATAGYSCFQLLCKIGEIFSANCSANSHLCEFAEIVRIEILNKKIYWKNKK